MQGKKTRPSGKSGGLELTKDSLGCAAWEGEVNEPEDWGGVLNSLWLECLHHGHPHAAFVSNSTCLKRHLEHEIQLYFSSMT